MPRGYSLEEVKQKVIDVLMHSSSGLSGVELAERTGINRVTITKYLNILESMGLIKRKCIGNVNLWYIQHGLDLTAKSALEVQRLYMDALLNYDISKARAVLVNSLHTLTPVGIVSEVVISTINTLNELYTRGMASIAELMIMNNIVKESLDAIKFNASREERYDAYAVILNLERDDMNSRLLDTLLYVKGWNAYLIDNVSLADLSLFFDIEMVKFLNKIGKRFSKASLALLCITVGAYEPIVNEFVKSIKEKIASNTFILVFMKGMDDSTESSIDKRYVDHYSKDVKDSIEWAERLYENYAR